MGIESEARKWLLAVRKNINWRTVIAFGNKKAESQPNRIIPLEYLLAFSFAWQPYGFLIGTNVPWTPCRRHSRVRPPRLFRRFPPPIRAVAHSRLCSPHFRALKRRFRVPVDPWWTPFGWEKMPRRRGWQILLRTTTEAFVLSGMGHESIYGAGRGVMLV
jgi:hypothetical protein